MIPSPPAPAPGGHQTPERPRGQQRDRRPGVTREKVRAFIERYREAHGRPPGFRLIGEACGITIGTVSHHVAKLRAEGRIGEMHPPPRVAPETSWVRRRIIADIYDERRAQDRQWGKDDFIPNLPPEIADMPPSPERAHALYGLLGLPTAGAARAACQFAHVNGYDSTARIALEEFMEWLEAVAWGDRRAMRQEAVQVAAYMAKVIERMDQEDARHVVSAPAA